MKCSDAIAEILKREGVRFVIGYRESHLEAAARADIRTIIVRQERVDYTCRCCEPNYLGTAGWGVCHAMGPGRRILRRVAQAYSESVPLVVLAGAMPGT